jgi:hypothetical protein
MCIDLFNIDKPKFLESLDFLHKSKKRTPPRERRGAGVGFYRTFARDSMSCTHKEGTMKMSFPSPYFQGRYIVFVAIVLYI